MSDNILTKSMLNLDFSSLKLNILGGRVLEILPIGEILWFLFESGMEPKRWIHSRGL